jgi:hypothetical protein
MLLNIFGIYCFFCHRYYHPRKVFVSYLFPGSISCEKDHLLGREEDPEWTGYFKIGE